MNLQIVKGQTGHERHGRAANRFRYPMFFLKFRSDAEIELQNTLRKKFFGLISFKATDYLWKKAGGVDENIRLFLKQKCEYVAEELWLVTMPRMFGYAFNPVSFWLCYRNGKLEAALCEVNNTFGERHFYWVKGEGDELTGRESSKKAFHVSPFLHVSGKYHFYFRPSQGKFRVDINYLDSKDQLKLSTWFEGQISPLEETSLASLILKYGWMSVIVVARIHFQAVKLWYKGATFFRKPIPPIEEVTNDQPIVSHKNIS